MIVTPKLVVIINPSHFLILSYCQWTRIDVGAIIFVLARNTIHHSGI